MIGFIISLATAAYVLLAWVSVALILTSLFARGASKRNRDRGQE